MAEPVLLPDLDEEARLMARSRALIAQRLAEIVSWPSTRIEGHERQLAGDILIGLLRTSGVELRARCAERLAMVVDAPKVVLRYLARDEIGVAQVLLETGVALDDCDLTATVRAGSAPHWLAIAQRRSLGESVTDALIQTRDAKVIEAILRNAGARMSAPGVDMVVSLSREHRHLVPILLRREEVKPAQGLTLFWWADADTRVHILRRFAVDRAVLLSEMADVFALAREEEWADPEARHALHFIERRQRNRDAAAASAFGSLEGLIAAVEVSGVTRDSIMEMAALAGLKPLAVARILADPGGEAIAVLCKATGLKRGSLYSLWRALRRPVSEIENPTTPFGRTAIAFESLATAKAQTVLRYWNWTLAADALNPAAPPQADHEFVPARRNAALVLGWRG